MKQFLHKHSTLYGLSASAMVSVIAAMVAQWEFPIALIAAAAAGIVGDSCGFQDRLGDFDPDGRAAKTFTQAAEEQR